MGAKNKINKLKAVLFISLALLLAPYSFISAENEYGGCAYNNGSYNANCPDAAEAAPASPSRSGGTIGNPWPAATISPTTKLPPTTFLRNLTVGIDGEDVRTLQKYLNSLGFTVAVNGPGSAGQETSRFGAATRAALIRFQLAKGISPAVGYFGPLTKNALMGTSIAPTNVAAAAAGARFERNLYLNDSGEDVRRLQQFLNARGFVVALTGPGSAGSETDFFGPATRAAVKKFQEAYASEILAPQGKTVGNGVVGPSTREKLNALK